MMPKDTNVHNCDFTQGKYWHTYEYLENILLDASDYITIDPSNDEAWSEVLATSLILNGNAVDTFLRNMIFCPNIQENKIFIDYLNKPKKKEDWTMKHYRPIVELVHELSKNLLEIPFGLGKKQNIIPFANFSQESPIWWRAYNDVKHNYYESLEKANLKNVLHSLGALLILNALHRCSKRYLAKQGIIYSEHLVPEISLLHGLKSDIGLAWEYENFPCEITTKIFVLNYRLGERKLDPRDV